MTQPANPFPYFTSSPEVIRRVVMMYVKFPLSLRNAEDLLAERGSASPIAKEVGRWADYRVENSPLPFRRRERAMSRFRRMKALRNFSSVHARSTATSTRRATSSAATFTESDAHSPWLSGGQSWAKASLGLGSLRLTGDKSPLV